MIEKKLKIKEYYNSFIKQYYNCFKTQYERCVIEEYRNTISKMFNIPSGHRWQFEEWYDIQNYAMQLLVDDGFIDETSKIFYCKRMKN
jgi:hypothetical protein